MGTPEFAVPALRRLVESGRHQVAAVVTQPDRPSGRGKKVQAPAVKDFAVEHGLAVLQPEKIRKSGFDQLLREHNPDVIIVAAYGRILPKEILELPRFGCINIHASLLPKYRGAAPIQWAIANGETKTGVTIMKMDEGLDTGDIIAADETDILPDDDTHSVSNILSVMGGELLLKVLDEIERTGTVPGTAQDNAAATLAPILKKTDGLVDWTMPTEQIICRIMGMQPWPTAFSYLHGQVWKFLRAEPFDGAGGLYFGEKGRKPDYDPGRVTALIKGRGFTVKTGDGHLLVTACQPAGKKVISGTDAVNGNLLRKGDDFVSDEKFLDGTTGVE